MFASRVTRRDIDLSPMGGILRLKDGDFHDGIVQASQVGGWNTPSFAGVTSVS